MEKTKQGQVGMGQRSLAQETWRRFKRNRLAIAGMVFIGVLLAISVITVILDLVNPELYNDLVVKNDLLNKLAEPSPEHILGCDEYGRDLLFRILWGTRYSLFAGVVTILAAILVGGTIGSIAGYYGKIVDNCIMRVMDMMMTVPSLVLAMALVAALGPSLVNLLIALSVSCSQRPVSGDRAGHAGRGNDHPQRGRTVLPGPGRGAARTGVGLHPELCTHVYAGSLAHLSVPGHCHRPVYSVSQSAGGRSAGCP